VNQVAGTRRIWTTTKETVEQTEIFLNLGFLLEPDIAATQFDVNSTSVEVIIELFPVAS